MLSKNGTDQLKGLAILLVVLGHLFVTKFFNSSNHSVNYLGAQGVAIFLILSGYGLTKSFLKQGIDRSFLTRRIQTVIIPYSFVTLIWIILDILQGKSYQVTILILSLIGFDLQITFDATMWYITFILLWYVIFFITFKLPLPNLLRIGILFGFSYLFRYHSHYGPTELVFWQWGLHAFMFPIGALWALLPNKYHLGKATPYAAIAGAILGFGFYFINVSANDSGLGPYMVSNFAFSFAVISLFLLFDYLDLSSRVLAFIGTISYEIYLLEAMFMYKFDLPYLIPNKGASLLLYGFALLVCSLYIKQVTTYLVQGVSLLTKPLRRPPNIRR